MLENILKYQELEGKLVAEESELLKSKDREKATEIQQVLKNQHTRLLTLENQAQKVNETYKQAVAKYEEFTKKLDELEKEIENANSSKMAFYEKAYKDFSAISSALEKDISNIHAHIQQISKEYEEIIRKSKEDRVKFDKFKASFAKLKAEKEPKIEELKIELQKAKEKVEPKLLNVYNQKRETKKFPVFVALVANKCGGCRMEISASKLGQMKTNEYGVIECENCGRLIYNK